MPSGSAEPSRVGLFVVFIGVATEYRVIMRCLLEGDESVITMSHITLRTL